MERNAPGFVLGRRIGHCFHGRGVTQDNVYAHMWWNIAASSGDENAIGNRDIVTKRMPSSQVERARELAQECIRKKYKGC